MGVGGSNPSGCANKIAVGRFFFALSRIRRAFGGLPDGNRALPNARDKCPGSERVGVRRLTSEEESFRMRIFRGSAHDLGGAFSLIIS